MRAGQPTPVFWPGESPWTKKPGGVESIGGCTELDMTEATRQQEQQYNKISVSYCTDKTTKA